MGNSDVQKITRISTLLNNPTETLDRDTSAASIPKHILVVLNVDRFQVAQDFVFLLDPTYRAEVFFSEAKSG